MPFCATLAKSSEFEMQGKGVTADPCESAKLISGLNGQPQHRRRGEGVAACCPEWDFSEFHSRVEENVWIVLTS